MRYLNAYMRAFSQIVCALSVVHLGFEVFSGEFFAHYIIYLTAVAAIAGPIAEAFGRKRV